MKARVLSLLGAVSMIVGATRPDPDEDDDAVGEPKLPGSRTVEGVRRAHHDVLEEDERVRGSRRRAAALAKRRRKALKYKLDRMKAENGRKSSNG